MLRLFYFLILVGILFSCSPSSKGLFGKKSDHERYGEGLKDAGLDRSALGTAWFNAAVKSLQQPLSINLPFKETGYFAAEKPSAAGYKFNLRRGENINVQVSAVPSTGVLLFIELWNNENKLVSSADTIAKKIQYEIEKDGSYVLRIQAELLESVEYTVTITTSASLAFPVRDADKPRITSFWGAARDGGARSHEGIDILAPRRTPIVASADGQITRVHENNLGGKVVYMRPDGKDYSLYYAHLDSQLVRSGQQVKAGDVIGLMGNTGNARTTAPHLHFGIYASGGAVDPLPFVDKNRAVPKKIAVPLENLNSYARTTSGQAVKITGAAESSYKVLYPDGHETYLKNSEITKAAIKKEKLKTDVRLLDQPTLSAPAKMLIKAGSEVTILGKHEQFSLVINDGLSGWILQ